jgi:hypothetical protein
MRCKNCDYVLWNLKARQCPECATPFKPSSYEFVPGSVRFCCPTCGQSYYGTDEKGHLSPALFDCVNCKGRIHIDEMVLLPAEGTSDQQTRVDRMPWLERRERGLVRSWFATIKWAMFQPNRLIRAVPEDASAGAAWVYALITSVLLLAIGWLGPQLLMVMGPISTMPGLSRMGLVFGPLGLVAAFIVWCGLSLILWALTAHGILKISGGTRRPLRRTCHALYYSAGACAPGIVPCCGGVAGWIWWIVSATNMLKEAQKVHGARAAIATLTWPVFSVLAMYVGLYVLMIYLMMGSFGGGAMGAWTPQAQATMSLSMSLANYAAQNGGAGPQHPVELLVGSATPTMWGGNVAFCDPSTQTKPKDVPLGSGTLQDFLDGGASAQFKSIAAVLDSTPSNLVAIRVGDFVFTYFGSTSLGYSGDPNLWTVVMVPDPDVNGAPLAGTNVFISTGFNNVQQITHAQLAAELATQNAHRATLGLPPLPDPATVTHGQPAVQGAAPVAAPTTAPPSPP